MSQVEMLILGGFGGFFVGLIVCMIVVWLHDVTKNW